MIARRKRDGENEDEDCRRGPDFNSDTCHFRTRADSPSQSSPLQAGQQMFSTTCSRARELPSSEGNALNQPSPPDAARHFGLPRPTNPSNQPTNHPPLPPPATLNKSSTVERTTLPPFRLRLANHPRLSPAFLLTVFRRRRERNEARDCVINYRDI